MELALRRAFLGYRRRPTVALFEALERETLAAQEAREQQLRELSSQFDAAAQALRDAEALVAAEQEQQQVLLALLDEFGARGIEMLESAKTAFGEDEAALLGEIARRELALAHRRQLLHALRDDVAAAVRRTLTQIEASPEPAEPRQAKPEAAPATALLPDQTGQEATRQEKAGA